MTRAEWFIWTIRYGDPRTRSRSLKAALRFELYSLGCRLSGLRVAHWLDEKPLPAGRYLLVKRPVPFGVKLLDRVFHSGRTEHVDHVPYTPEAAEGLKRGGAPVEIVTVSYRLGGAGRPEQF
jgi:hypothetical protein